MPAVGNDTDSSDDGKSELEVKIRVNRVLEPQELRKLRQSDFDQLGVETTSACYLAAFTRWTGTRPLMTVCLGPPIKPALLASDDCTAQGPPQRLSDANGACSRQKAPDADNCNHPTPCGSVFTQPRPKADLRFTSQGRMLFDESWHLGRGSDERSALVFGVIRSCARLSQTMCGNRSRKGRACSKAPIATHEAATSSCVTCHAILLSDLQRRPCASA